MVPRVLLFHLILIKLYVGAVIRPVLNEETEAQGA